MASVVQSLLTDVAGATVVIDPSVTGELTIHSKGQLTAAEVPGFLKTAVKVIGLDLTDQGNNTYLLQPERRADGRSAPPTVYQPGVEARTGLMIMGLRYVSAGEMVHLLAPFARNGVTVQPETSREMLIMSGPPDAVDAMVRTAELLDVDWLQGMSFGIVPLDYSDPDGLIAELKTLFGGGDGPIGTMVEFVPLKARHAILILAKRPERLDEARNWIAQLDRPLRGHAGAQVIPLKYADALEMAELVKKLYPGGQGGEKGGAATQVTADPTHNALLVQADPAVIGDIRATVETLDTPVPQVEIETTIAEVTLNNDLRFGIQWAVDGGGNGSAAFTQGANATPTVIFPGLSYAFHGASVQATLNTLASKTNVEVISSPVIVTLNNKPASLEVGDQVPIIVQTAANVTTPNASVVNSVEYRDTGVLLKVTPRIGAGDVITIEVSQEASEVAPTTTSGIDSPTIQQRKFSSTVSVRTGQTVVLGGLIRASRSHTKAGIPYIRDIPLLGEAAGNRSDKLDRTELLVFLTPRILRTDADAASLSDDLKQRLEALHASTFINRYMPTH